MVETADPNKKHYFKQVGSPRTIKQILKKVVEEKETAQLWTQGNEQSSENYRIEGVEGDATLILKSEGSFWTQFSASPLASTYVMFRTTLDKMQYFCSGTLEFDKPRRLHLLPLDTSKFFQCQQRGMYRLTADNKTKIKLVLDNRTYACYDISGGGISFFARGLEQDRYSKGKIFKNGVVKLNDKTLNIPYLVIINVLEYKDNQAVGKIKVCIQFKDVDEEVTLDLCKYINTLARDRDQGKPIGD
jgi:hypothetical protein